MFTDNKYNYMPVGSYTIGADIRAIFHTDAEVYEIGNGIIVYIFQKLPEEIKQRFLKEVKQEYEIH